MKSIIKAIGLLLGGYILLALLCFPEVFRPGMSNVSHSDAEKKLSKMLHAFDIRTFEPWSIAHAAKSPGRDSTYFMQFSCSEKEIANLTNMLWQADGREYIVNRKWLVRKGEPSEILALARTPKWWPSAAQGFTVLKCDSVVVTSDVPDSGIWFFIRADRTICVWIWDT